MDSFDLSSYLFSKQKQVNRTIDEIIDQTTNSSVVVSAMRHSLLAEGKRIRPVLCIAASQAVGGRTEDVLMAACALEMIHAYSLIHDDLPAMDNDDLRRGKPTCHIAFNEATAILAGDALLTLAFEILSSIDLNHIKVNNAVKWLRVINIIAKAAGYKGMIEGQIKDIAAEGNRIGLKDLEKMHALKTGALIEASISTGAILGNGSVEQIQQLNIYAKNIGLAFQVIDDILNVEGDPAVMGKDVGTDQVREKSTYPSILGIEKSKEFAKNLVNNALQALNYFDNKFDPLRAIAHYIIDRKK
ncbi:MAG: polyprenyl synthetase family protein [Deltaproteobacteria bacterium]|nr:polyprenyl synthetase family protein [Deltaproteobacteria bacterium]